MQYLSTVSFFWVHSTHQKPSLVTLMYWALQIKAYHLLLCPLTQWGNGKGLPSFSHLWLPWSGLNTRSALLSIVSMPLPACLTRNSNAQRVWVPLCYLLSFLWFSVTDATFHAITKGLHLDCSNLDLYSSALYSVLLLAAMWCILCSKLLHNSPRIWSFLVSPSKWPHACTISVPTYRLWHRLQG